MRRFFLLLTFLGLYHVGYGQEQRSPLDSADLYMAKADSLFLLDEDYDQAQVFYGKAEILFRQEQNVKKLIACLINNSRMMLWQPTYAINKAHEALKLVNSYQIKDYFYKGYIYSVLCEGYTANQQIKKAKVFADKFLAIMDSMPFRPEPSIFSKIVQHERTSGLYQYDCLNKKEYLTELKQFYKAYGYHDDEKLVKKKIEHNYACEEFKDTWQYKFSYRKYENIIMIDDLLEVISDLEKFQLYSKRRSIFKTLQKVIIQYYRLGLLKEALYYSEKSVEISEKIYPHDLGRQSKSYNKIGELFRQLGEYEKALNYYKRAYQLVLKYKGEINFSIGSVCNNIGETYYALGNYKEALNWHQQALDIRLQIADHPYRTNSYDNLGMTYLKLGDLDQAKLYLQKGLVLREQFPKTIQYERYYIKSYKHLAEWYQLNQQTDVALKYCFKALAANLSDSKEDQLAKYIIWNRIGELELEQEHYSAALNAFEEALRSNVDDATKPLHAYISGQSLLRSLKGKGQVFTQTGELTQALTNYELAIELLHKTRKAFSTQQDKLFISKKSRAVYEEAMDVAYQLYLNTQDDHYLARMFAISEQSKAGILLDAQNLQQAKSHVLPDSILEKESRLSALISYYQQRVKSSESVDVAAWEQRLFETKRAQEAFNLSLEQHFPTYYQLKHQGHHVTVTGIQQQLQDREVFLEFFVGKNEVYAFRLNKTDFELKVLPKPSLSSIQQFRHAILNQDWENYSANCATFIRYSHQLYTNLIEPFGKLSAQKLVIIPDGMLWHVNFDLLLKERPADEDYRSFQYLMRDVAIRYGYSGVHLIQNSTKSINYSGGLLAFAPSYESLAGATQKLEGLGKFRNEVGILKYNQEEVIQIAAQIAGDVYTGYDAVETKFKTELADYSILHLAMHALIDNADPNNSRLVFTHDEDTMEDNFLHVYELYHMKMPVDLAVLSACNTGFGKLEGGEGLMSLGRAFAYAGCPAVVMSHWKVDDLATSDLMNRFYENLASGMEKSVALQQAKLNYLESSGPREALPFLWGSFVLLGDDSVIKVETKWIRGYHWGIMGLLVLGSLLFIKRWYK